jgi:hypothetical protein
VSPSPINRLRGEERSYLSPPEGPASRILPRLDEDLFQALPDKITARGGANTSDGGPRRPIFRPDPAAQTGQACFRGQGRHAYRQRLARGA